MSSISQTEMKALAQAQKLAELAQKNKEAARAHLLAVQTYLASRTPVTRQRFGS